MFSSRSKQEGTMRSGVAFVAAALTILPGSTFATSVDDAPSASPTIKLTRMVTDLPAGAVWQVLQIGYFCIQNDSSKAEGVPQEGDVSRFAPAFSRGFGNAAGVTASQPINLFDPSHNSTAADYQVGSIVRDLQLKYCAQGVLGTKVDAHMTIEWQVYSAAKGAVVATMQTSGDVKFKGSALSTALRDEALLKVFVENVGHLAAMPEMRSLLSSTAAGSKAVNGPTDTQRISASASSSTAQAIADVVGSVVLIRLGDGFGSGVLISSDGYVLTNEHVVGRAKSVRVRWSDGFETTGSVIKTHGRRDVALIKTDTHGRAALPIRTTPVQPGETVLAIGAPADEALQNTITRGVVSANRILNGFSFIQSDVTVNHGNSGGPLVDEKGRVVGLTDIGYHPDDNTIGLNFFIPIKDALDFLSLDLIAPPPPAAEPPPVQAASAPQAGGKVSAR
jgi:serine protease Do